MAVYKTIKYVITPKFQSEEAIEPIVEKFIILNHSKSEVDFEKECAEWNSKFKEYLISHIGEFQPGIIEMHIESYWSTYGYTIYWIPEEAFTQELNVLICKN